jgi:hypothetical protein
MIIMPIEFHPNLREREDRREGIYYYNVRIKVECEEKP